MSANTSLGAHCASCAEAVPAPPSNDESASITVSEPMTAKDSNKISGPIRFLSIIFMMDESSLEIAFQ